LSSPYWETKIAIRPLRQWEVYIAIYSIVYCRRWRLLILYQVARTLWRRLAIIVQRIRIWVGFIWLCWSILCASGSRRTFLCIPRLSFFCCIGRCILSLGKCSYFVICISNIKKLATFPKCSSWNSRDPHHWDPILQLVLQFWM
jgi:hypothetical protein